MNKSLNQIWVVYLVISPVITHTTWVLLVEVEAMLHQKLEGGGLHYILLLAQSHDVISLYQEVPCVTTPGGVLFYKGIIRHVSSLFLGFCVNMCQLETRQTKGDYRACFCIFCSSFISIFYRPTKGEFFIHVMYALKFTPSSIFTKLLSVLSYWIKNQAKIKDDMYK